MVKKAVFVIINCVLNCILLLLGQEFILVALFLSIINIIIIPILFRKENNLMMAIMTVILMALFSMIQMLDGFYNGDDGGFLFMCFFTMTVTIIPMTISAVVHLVIHFCKKIIDSVKKKRNKLQENPNTEI